MFRTRVYVDTEVPWEECRAGLELDPAEPIEPAVAVVVRVQQVSASGAHRSIRRRSSQ